MMIRSSVMVLMLAGCASGGAMPDTAIDAIVSDLVGSTFEQPSPGAGVIVTRGDEIVFRRSYGFADVENRVPATPATNYRLASVSKQFTAAAILLLAERKELGLDDQIDRWLPDLPEVVGSITLRQLLTHTSGIVDYEDLIPDEATRQVADRDVLRLVEQSPQLYFEPGSSYSYSNTGYALLALIVERATGLSFAEFLANELFPLASMKSSIAFEDGVSEVEHRAWGYSRDDEGEWVRTDQSITSAVLGDGGIYSSIDDVARWSRAFHRGDVLGLELTRLATSPLVRTDQEGIHYGFGWRVSEHRGHRMIWHSGETIGFRNVSLFFPDEDLTVIVLSNQNERRPLEYAMQIADPCLEH